MSRSYSDSAVTTLRTLVATIERELASAAPPDELRIACARMVALLALGPPPDLRECATCHNAGMRAATRCMYCWSSLPPLEPLPASPPSTTISTEAPQL